MAIGWSFVISNSQKSFQVFLERSYDLLAHHEAGGPTEHAQLVNVVVICGMWVCFV